MYESLIKKYINKLTINDINNFAKQNNIILPTGEDKTIYDFIINNWKEIYNSKDLSVFNEIKTKISNNTYNKIIELYNIYKEKIGK